MNKYKEIGNQKELNEKFKVYGSFYNVTNVGQEIAKCRNNLEIFQSAKRLGDQINQFTVCPDAIFIMMNPGSSKPLNDLFERKINSIEISLMSEEIIKNMMVPTKPDNTQYQIMKIMSHQNWNHVRVVNLSDIREGNCEIFFKKVEKFNKKFDSDIHSFFSDKREIERKEALSIKKNNPIILAWGCDKLKSYIQLKENAVIKLKKLKHKKIIGLEHKNIPNSYYHPLPPSINKQKKWIEDINNKIKK